MRVPDAVYSAAQRAAVALAYEDLSRTEVARLAAEGKLRGVDGELLPAFDLNAGSVAGIARRVRRSGAGEDDGLTPETARRLYNRLAVRAKRRAASARTAQEIRDAARALEEVERLRGKVERLPAPAKPTELAGSILAAARSAGPAPPPELPQPVKAPEPEPEPEIPLGDRIAAEMRAQLEDAVRVQTAPVAAREFEGAVDDSDIQRAEWGHPAFGLHRHQHRNRIRGTPSNYGVPW